VKHATEQLLLLHGWTETKDPASLAAIDGAVDAIQKSRVAAASLNYKIEAVKIPALPLQPLPGAESPVPTSAGPTPTPTAPTPTDEAPAPAKGGKPPPKPGKKDDKAAAANPERQAALVAATVGKYVRERSEHHGIHNLVLGVGNSAQGKNVAIGSVARELVSTSRSQQRLFFVKATGPVIRPASSLRMLCLVVPGMPLDHVRDALSLCQVEGKNDRLGVIIVVNSGKPKPNRDVLTTATVEEDGVTPTYTEVQRQCTALLKEYGLEDAPSTGEDGAPSVAAETFPLINLFTLEPTKEGRTEIPTPTIDEGAAQLTKFVGGFKVDFLVVPPAGPRGELGDAFVNACLAAPKPHVLLL